MAIQDLLVHVDDTKGCESRLHAAVQMARTHQAHLTGLYVIPPVENFLMYAVEPLSESYRERMQKPLLERRDAARAMFDAATDDEEIAAEWRDTEGGMARSLNTSARYADLIIVGQNNPDDPADKTEGVVSRLVLGSGRPCLVIPYIGAQETLGKHVLVAWNAGREAVRAVNDALPILQAAESVSVLAVDPPSGKRGEGPIPSADICHHLARHGVHAEAASSVVKDIEIGSFLLSHAADRGVDMIVMGAYGHSRLSEMMLGGVTRSMLQHMTVPVFMSH
jgi:nucleotide-binding universal stress UspA family protein